MEKLRRSFDIKLVKFSTILTEKSLKILTDIVLYQFYLIEEFVHNSSDIIQMKINNFINEVNNTSVFLENLGEYIYIKVLGFYKILYSSIQNKYQIISNRRRLEFNALEARRIDSTQLDIMKDDFSLLLDELETQIKSEIKKKISEILKEIDKKLKKLSDKYTREISYKGQVGIPFPILPFFEIVLRYKVYAGMGLNIFLENISEDNLYPILNFDAYAWAKVQLYIETGFYVPSNSSPVQINFMVGMGGTVGDGRAGIKIQFSFMERNFELDIYFILNAFQFEFYVQIRIFINIPFCNYETGFDIIRYNLKGIMITFNEPKKQDMSKNMLINSKRK